MSISRVMAELAIQTKPDGIGDKARLAAKKLILDTLGTTIAGHNAPGIAPILDQIREWGGRPEASLLVHGGKVSAPDAAYLNGCMAHALDLDDVHLPGSLHIMSSVLPVALAIAEQTHASGGDILTAVILGVEVAGRLGVEYNKRRQHGGFLNATIVGGFGTTASACRLLGMTVDQTVHALGLYHSQNCGNRQALYDHTLAKRIQPGWAARNAIWAAALARRGVSGPENAFEGSCGLFRIYGAAPPPSEEELSGPREFFEIERTSIKRFASCGAMHAAVQAALDLAREHDLKPHDIGKVVLYLGEGRNQMVGGPWRMGPHPQVDAQFCAAYCVALALMRRTAALSAMTDEAIRSDSETRKLAEQIEIATHWEFAPPIGKSSWQYHVPQIVRVHTRDGRTLECSRTRKDVFDPDAVTYEDAARKFHECAEFSGRFRRAEAQAIVDTVRELEGVSDAEAFVRSRLIAVEG